MNRAAQDAVLGTLMASLEAGTNDLTPSVAGTVEASKMLLVGANKELDALVIADGGLSLGSGAGTAVTSTAAELNLLDGVVAGDIAMIQRQAADAVMVVGTEVPDTINVTIQLQDGDAVDLTTASGVLAYLSDDADGSSVTATAPTGGVAIGVDGLAIPIVAGKYFQLVSEADGDIDLDIIDTGTPTFYLVVIMPNGDLVVSSAITFA